MKTINMRGYTRNTLVTILTLPNHLISGECLSLPTMADLGNGLKFVWQ